MMNAVQYIVYAACGIVCLWRVHVTGELIWGFVMVALFFVSLRCYIDYKAERIERKIEKLRTIK